MEGKFLSFPCCFLREKVPLKAPTETTNAEKNRQSLQGNLSVP